MVKATKKSWFALSLPERIEVRKKMLKNIAKREQELQVKLPLLQELRELETQIKDAKKRLETAKKTLVVHR